MDLENEMKWNLRAQAVLDVFSNRDIQVASGPLRWTSVCEEMYVFTLYARRASSSTGQHLAEHPSK